MFVCRKLPLVGLAFSHAGRGVAPARRRGPKKAGTRRRVRVPARPVLRHKPPDVGSSSAIGGAVSTVRTHTDKNGDRLILVQTPRSIS